MDGIQFSPMKPKELLFPALTIELATGTTILKNDFESSPAWPWQERSITSVNQIEQHDLFIKTSETGIIDVDIFLG